MIIKEVIFKRKRRVLIKIFILISLIYLFLGIMDIYKKINHYGIEYLVSSESIYVLSFLFFVILLSIYFIFVVKNKWVLKINEEGVLDKRFLFGKVFIPWKKIKLLRIETLKDSDYLLVEILKTERYVDVIDKMVIVHKIPLKNLNFDRKKLDDFINNIYTI